MATLPNVEQILQLYFEADRSAVRRRYETMFGRSSEQGSASEVAKLVDTTGVETDNQDEQAEQVCDHDTPHDKKASSAGLLAEVEADFRSDMDLLCNQLGVPSELLEDIEAVWPKLPARGKIVAADLFSTLFEGGVTLPYTLEGLVRIFGTWRVSSLLHAVCPDYAFPVIRDFPYLKLREILDLFSVEYDDDEDCFPFEVWWSLTSAIAEFREKQAYEHWQAWALVYDLGPRLLARPAAYPTTPPRIWIIAVNNKLGEFAEVDEQGPRDIGSWAINPKAKRGDLALLYCVAPRSAVVAVFRVMSDSHRDPFGGWNGYRAEIGEKIPMPWITIQEMKTDEVLKDWRLVRRNLQGLLKFEVPEEMWERLKFIWQEKDAEVVRQLDQFVNAGQGTREIRLAGETWTEVEVEQKLVIPVLAELGWKLDQTLVQQVPMLIKVGSGRPKNVRADFVGYSGALTSIALLVVEVKRKISSAAQLQLAAEQAESYAGKLRCNRYAVASPEGFWVYELTFPGQSHPLAAVELDEGTTKVPLTKLEPLIGYERLRMDSEGTSRAP
ncbi:MAG: hypothetical protein ABI614_03845 [Planctomycetota bacterium]